MTLPGSPGIANNKQEGKKYYTLGPQGPRLSSDLGKEGQECIIVVEVLASSFHKEVEVKQPHAKDKNKEVYGVATSSDRMPVDVEFVCGGKDETGQPEGFSELIE